MDTKKTCVSKPVEALHVVLSTLCLVFKEDRIVTYSQSIPEFANAMEVNFTLASKLAEMSQVTKHLEKELLQQIKQCTMDRNPTALLTHLNAVLQNKDVFPLISGSLEYDLSAAANHALITALVREPTVKETVDQELWGLLEACSQLSIPSSGTVLRALETDEFHLEEETDDDHLKEENKERNPRSLGHPNDEHDGKIGCEVLHSFLEESRKNFENLDNKISNLEESRKDVENLLRKISELTKLVENMEKISNAPKVAAIFAQENETNVQRTTRSWLYRNILKAFSILQSMFIVFCLIALLYIAAVNTPSGTLGELAFFLILIPIIVFSNCLIVYKQIFS